MKRIFIFILILFGFAHCKDKTKSVESRQIVTIPNSTSIDTTNIQEERFELSGLGDYKSLLKRIKGVRYTGNKYSDWATNNRSYILADLFGMDREDYNIRTTSYTFKNDCIFYLHTISHIDKNKSMKSFIENIRGKHTRENKMGVRVLIFAMTDEKKASFVDIPPNYGYSKLRNDLIEKVYSEIDFMVISCDSTEVCRVRDLRD